MRGWGNGEGKGEWGEERIGRGEDREGKGEDRGMRGGGVGGGDRIG